MRRPASYDHRFQVKGMRFNKSLSAVFGRLLKSLSTTHILQPITSCRFESQRHSEEKVTQTAS